VAVGFWSVDVLPFPNVHSQEVAPVDRFWKETTRGEHPLSGVAEKLAMGFWARMPGAERNRRSTAIIFIGLKFRRGLTGSWFIGLSGDRIRVAKTIPITLQPDLNTTVWNKLPI
jgi:hypothetical protein